MAVDRLADRVRLRLDCLAHRHRPVEACAARGAESVLSRTQPAAERAARQGDRRLHRGGAARPRHDRPALCARQPVPPSRRVRARGARAPAPAAARRPRRRRSRARTACVGAGLRQGRPARPRRRGVPRTRRHRLRHRVAPGAAVAGRTCARLAHRCRRGRQARGQRHGLVCQSDRASLVRAGAASQRHRRRRSRHRRAAPCARGRAACAAAVDHRGSPGHAERRLRGRVRQLHRVAAACAGAVPAGGQRLRHRGNRQRPDRSRTRDRGTAACSSSRASIC